MPSLNSYLPPLSFDESLSVIPFTTNAGVVFGGFIMTVFGAISAFRLFSLANNYGKMSSRRLGLLLLSGLLLSLGSWSSHLLNGRIALLPTTSTQSAFIQFNPRFVCLSFLLPLVLACASTVLLSIRRLAMCCRCITFGVLVGFSIDFMHYALLLSTPLDVRFSPTRLALSFLLCVLASMFSCATLLFLKRKWDTCSCIRIVVPVLFGAGISGANALALSGTHFLERPGTEFPQMPSRSAKAYWDGITLCLPSAIAAVLCLTSIYIVFKDFARNKWRCPIPPSPKLIIASIAFSDEGRVLVNDKGLLPMQVVDLNGLKNDIMSELRSHKETFHWLYTLSFNWPLLVPYLPSIRERIQWCGVEGRIRAAFDMKHPAKHARWTVPPTSTLKTRLLEAVVRLAGDINVPVTEIGHLYDRTLNTGTHMGIAEFLVLSEHEASRLRDLEKSLQSCTPGDHTGLMLFLVRDLPNIPLVPEAEQLQKYAEKGYRLQYMRRFRDALAQALNASQREVDKMLLGCREHKQSGTRPILEPGATYVSLFAERSGSKGGREVLVYDVAKHQIPSVRLDLKTFSSEMQRWLRDISTEVRTTGGLLALCNDDVEKSDEEILMTRLSSILCDSFDEPYLYDFKKALADAIERLLLELDFIDNLRTESYLLSPTVVAVPSSGRKSAHLIIFKLDVTSPPHDDPDSQPSSPEGGIHTVNVMSDTHTSSSGSCKTATPAAFTYTPRSLFDISQSIMVGATEDLMTDVAAILKRLYPAPLVAVAAPSPVQTTMIGTDRALTSTFSIDSLSEAGSVTQEPQLTSSTRSRYLNSSKRRLYALATAIKSFLTGVSSRKAKRRASGTQPVEVVIRSMGTNTLMSVNETHLCSTIYPPSRNAMEVKPPGHPYLQPRMPSPVVLASHVIQHKRRTSSVVSFVASDETVTSDVP